MLGGEKRIIAGMSSTARILDGRAVAQEILEASRQRVARIVAQSGVVPCLATVLVGDDPASVTYTRMKRQRCESIGMRSVKVELPASISTAQLIQEIQRLGRDPAVHGILLQHPVPPGIDERAAFEAIPPIKDVDGVTIASFGAVSFDRPEMGYACCTPEGIMRLLRHYQIPVEGRHAVVIGRSPILGKPMAMMLLAAHATVTICHSRTQNLPEVVRQADIVVAAVGRPRFVQGDWLKPGCVVVDAGYNPGNVGDVDFDTAAKVAGWITPVPGGVGPMTVATLIDHTVTAAERQLGLSLSYQGAEAFSG